VEQAALFCRGGDEHAVKNLAEATGILQKKLPHGGPQENPP